MAGVAEAAVVLASVVIWSTVGSPSASPSDGASRSPTPSTAAVQPLTSGAGPSGSPVGLAGGCPAEFAGQARCPAEPECFDQLQLTGGVARAGRLNCSARHTWETFAMADLPGAQSTVDHRSVSSDRQVLAVCSPATLALVAGFSAIDWRIEVLPPTPEAIRAGDRAYRCLAGRGPGALTGPTLGHAP